MQDEVERCLGTRTIADELRWQAACVGQHPAGCCGGGSCPGARRRDSHQLRRIQPRGCTEHVTTIGAAECLRWRWQTLCSALGMLVGCSLFLLRQARRFGGS